MSKKFLKVVAIIALLSLLVMTAFANYTYNDVTVNDDDISTSSANDYNDNDVNDYNDNDGVNDYNNNDYNDNDDIANDHNNNDYNDNDDVANDNDPQAIKIGVSAAHFDNVGQILRHFSAGIDIYVLSHADAANIERLKEFYAIFINCGSHSHFDYHVLNEFVYQGGIVYASDLAGRVLQSAFPGIAEFSSNPSQIVEANIVHSTLASHMRIEDLDVIFDLSGWYSITDFDDNATVYIKGDLYTYGLTPLAISFDYGEGTVFYTSFHNSVQATSHMINFIEYLIFRIKNIEVDRNLQYLAEREGFIYRGAVFDMAGTRRIQLESFSPDVAFAAPGAPAAPVPGAMPWGTASPSPASPAMPQFDEEAPADHTPETFNYTFEGNGFMLMFGAGSEFYYVTLTDPYGNIFIIDNYGTVTGNITDLNAMQPSITLEVSDGYRVRVTNITPGEWSFSAVPRSGNYSSLMIGIAVMQ
ncbi:MAG: hypothetical protein FWC91_03380 [Defluviitaleaceae bacterium]|nr:hypothetical protein [Defluviitaleaceae bacterium]